MEYDKINNLLLSEDNESEQLSKFVTREYVRVNSLSNTYNENKSIRFKTPMLRSNLCDYFDAYILVKGTITVNGIVNGAENEILRRNRPLIFKNNAPFVSCMTKINNEFSEDADDLEEKTTEAINNNLNILIDPTFANVNRLFVLAYMGKLIMIDNHVLDFIYQMLW